MNQTKKWVRITPVESIPLREGRSVRVGGREIAIFNLGDRFLAVENRCPHRGGPLADGIVSGTTVVCPLHAWKIDLVSGTVTNQPGEVPCVSSYRTRVEKGVIAIEIGFAGSEEERSQPDCFASISQDFSPSQTASGEV